MARYIDADELLNRLPDDLPYKASVKRVLMQAPTIEVEILNKMERSLRGLLVVLRFSYKSSQREFEIKEECYKDFISYIEELKNKYSDACEISTKPELEVIDLIEKNWSQNFPLLWSLAEKPLMDIKNAYLEENYE